jgi:hypothetical protein
LREGEESVGLFVKLPQSQFDRVAKLAQRHDTSMGAVVRTALRRALGDRDEE